MRFGQVYKADQGHYYNFINPLKHQWLDLTIGKQTNNLVAPRKSTPPIILVKKIIFIISNKFSYKFFEIFQNFKQIFQNLLYQNNQKIFLYYNSKIIFLNYSGKKIQFISNRYQDRSKSTS